MIRADPSVPRRQANFGRLIELYRLPYADTHRFAPLVLDHLAQDPFVRSLSDLPPTFEGLSEAARRRNFDPERRRTLIEVLRSQYEGLELSEAVRANLDALARDGTLTVTTGHQLCLFTGPLYVPLKILNTVKIAARLSEGMGRKVVPVFWMATEDHDRAEIDHAWINGGKVEWKGVAGDAVGRLRLQGIDPVIEAAAELLGPGEHALELVRSMQKCYRSEFTLAQATRLFVNELFGRFGIICLDADDAGLKRSFIPVMRSELLEGITAGTIAPATSAIADRYKVQANSREINLFHLSEGARARIERTKDGGFAIEGKERRSSRQELLEELDRHPDRFSPNVLLRPLYQETILPNVAYIGGGGELAYWLQLKPLFEHFEVPMPVLLLRSSVAILAKKEADRAADLGLSVGDLFRPAEQLEQQVAIRNAGFSTGMEQERSQLRSFYALLEERAASIDPTLVRSAGSAAHLAFKGIDHMEKRFIRAAKRKAADSIGRLHMVLDALFPNGGLQERRDNLMTFTSGRGTRLFDDLYDLLDPLDQQFTVLIDDPTDRG